MGQQQRQSSPIFAILIIMLILIGITALGLDPVENPGTGINEAAFEDGASSRTPTTTPTLTPFPSLTPTSTGAAVDILFQPIWACPSPSPQPTACRTDNSGNPVCDPPEATATPYVLVQDFPLGRKVQVGPIGRDELGIWVTLDNYQTLSTNTLVDTTDDSLDNPQPASIAVWSVEVENTSRSLPFEFVAIALSYITQVQTSTGVINSEWFFDPLAVEEAMTHRDVASNADFSILEAFLDTNSDFTEDESEYISEFYIFPGFSKKVWLATYIPQGSATRIGYTFRPSDDGSEFPGGNVGIWRTQTNSDDQRCPEGSIAVPPEGLDAIPIPSGEFTLARWPTDSQVITRGFGCTADFTGELGSGCPAGAPWFHNGIDITTPVGSTYYSVIPDLSSVSFAGEDGNGVDCSGIFPDAQPPTTGYGIYIQQSGIVNGRTVSVVGAHLSSTSVITLSAVSDGQSIGRTGNTGCSSSPHLHFSVQVDGVFVDPLTVLP